jgi:hypothetical protein
LFFRNSKSYDEDEDGVITIMEPEKLSHADGAA